MKYLLALTVKMLLLVSVTYTQEEFNYDEAAVPDYDLPNLMISSEGRMINTVAGWENIRRPEILSAFETQVYGKIPQKPIIVAFNILEESHEALGGIATRKQIAIDITLDDASITLQLLLYIPKEVVTPAPAFLGLNFYGNHTIHPDTNILITDSWVRNNEEFHITANKATAASRGVRQNRWPVEQIIHAGYALGVMYYGDIDPDYDDGFENGIHALFHQQNSPPKADEWGSLAAWAWGLSRGWDYLATDVAIDENRVAVMGHSRLGKAALWAGASDPRFALVISNNSGCGGAALSRRQFGETVKRINTNFPHWFCDNFTQYNDKEAELPIDQHMLIALMAPRPVYVASAAEDLWADPKGEYLSAYHATPAFKLYDLEGLPSSTPPDVNSPLADTHVGYHIRTGKHDVTTYDWEQYIQFADLHFK